MKALKARTHNYFAKQEALSCCLSIALTSLLIMGFAACTTSSSQSSMSTTALRTVEKSDARPFSVYFLDSDEGECILIDIGEKEIIIDAGGTRSQLREYVTKTDLIQDPIELVVVTNSDFRSWRGLSDLFELDNEKDSRTYHAMELWEPGYNRNAGDTPNPNSPYGKFLEKIQSLPDTKLNRPLEAFHAPSNKTGKIEPFTLPSLPGVTFTLLHSDKNPDGDESVGAKNSSIVLLIEISGIRMLFTSNAPGKDSFDPATIEPKYVEGQLLALNRGYPGILQADLMTVPRHGGADASTQAFIDAVNPKIVISSSLARFNFPLAAVMDRYQKLGRRVFLTSSHPEPGLDHIVCTNQISELNEEGDSDKKITANLNCLYNTLDAEGHSKWMGFLRDHTPYDQEKLSSYLSDNEERLGAIERGDNRHDKDKEMPLDMLKGADLRGADLSGRKLSGLDLSGVDLRFTNLSGANLSFCNLSGANLSYAFSQQPEINPNTGPEKNTKFVRANLSGATLNYAQLPYGELSEALLDNASLLAAYLPAAALNGTHLSNSNLDYANLREARIIGGKLDKVTLSGADLTRVIFEPEPGFLPSFNEFIRAPYLESLSFERSPHALVELREAFKKAGLRQQERILTFDIEHQKRLHEDFLARTFEYVLFESTARYGLSPMRPLKLVLLIWFIFSLLYYILLRSSIRSGLILVVARRRTDDPGKYRTKTLKLRCHSLQGVKDLKRWKLLLVSEFRLLMASINFGLRSMFNLKFQWLEAGTWLRMVQRRQYDLEAVGWVRTLSGLQSLISMYLLALCILTYFGRPFD